MRRFVDRLERALIHDHGIWAGYLAVLAGAVFLAIQLIRWYLANH